MDAVNMFSFYIFTLLFYLQIVSGANDNIYRFCVYEYDASGVPCQAIQKGNSLVMCVPVSDSADCAMKILRKEADFGIFTAEEALLAMKFINNDVQVIGQLRDRTHDNESFAFETVVVVRENFNGGFDGLRSMNYCHPGFADGQTWSDRILKDFEKAVVPRSCHEDYANAQQEVYSIDNFFKSVCRPGQWVLDDYLDRKLKKKFPSMCDLCDVRSRCSYSDESQGSHIAALRCLTKNGGDVTYVALQHVKEYFGLIPGYAQKAKPEEYKFLCPDGFARPLNQPCTWLRQPWPAVVAERSKAQSLSNILPTFLCDGPGCRGKWQEAFTKLFEDSTNKFHPINVEKTLMDNLVEGRTIPREVEGDACRRVVRWCTTTEEENEKCTWLAQAVTAQDFEPRLTCVPTSSMWSCFDLIRKKGADIIAIDNDYAFTAERVFNLTTVMYQDNVLNGNYLITAVVRADRQDIRSLNDLKGKRACFPEYNGLAWNTFIQAAQKKSILPQVCPKIKAVSQFFKDLCVPGAIDKDHKDYNVTGVDNLCSLCVKKSNNSKDNCEATFNNKFYGHFGAFSCLVGSNSTSVADVAFVDYRQLMSKQNEDVWKNIKKADYRILCENGTLIPFPEGKDADLDEKCAFSNGIRGQIVTRKQNSKATMRDIADLLLKMKDKFGEVVSEYDNIIRMFGSFKGKKGVLLQETTVDFISIYDDNNHQVNYFKELRSSAFEECQESSKKSAANVNNINLAASLLVFVAILFNLL
ncbi:transferrin-like isoform X2 [Planococcus citri]|uniref:transferrin-like isoform X2 n=1 Tax=Planococcus citri TaxID=170843 RepID=UPI0031F8B9F1